MSASRSGETAGLTGLFDSSASGAAKALLTERNLNKGERLDCVSEGEAALGVVLSGRLEISRPTEFPERRVVMGLLGPGAMVGETRFFGGEGCSDIITALEPTRVALLGESAWTKLMAESPSDHAVLVKAALRTMALRLCKAYGRMSEVF